MKIVFLRQPYKFIRKSDEKLKERIKTEILQIQKAPYEGEKLTGKLKGLFCHHFSYIDGQYRIVYQIREKVIVVALGTRENFYNQF